MDAGLGLRRAAGPLGLAALLCGLAAAVAAHAQDTPGAVPPPPPELPTSGPSPAQDRPLTDTLKSPAPDIVRPSASAPASLDNSVMIAPEPEAPRAKLAAPDVSGKPVRSPGAVLRVLDKVTAETMAFEAPVGRRVRYKRLIFEVKACETRQLANPIPQPSAYVVITSDAGLAAGDPLGPRPVFKGWMFANDPSAHAVANPTYDAWLVACTAAVPPA